MDFFFSQGIRIFFKIFEYIRIRSISIFENFEIFEFVRFFFFLSGNIRIRSNINGDNRECSRVWKIIKNLWDEYSKLQNLLYSLEYSPNYASNITREYFVPSNSIQEKLLHLTR